VNRRFALNIQPINMIGGALGSNTIFTQRVMQLNVA
jgi:hypothetical protein